MAHKVTKKTKKGQNSAAQAAEDLNVLFPDVSITVAGQQVVVREYPFMQWLELRVDCGELIESLAELISQKDEVETDELLEFFENHFQEIKVLILESIAGDAQFLSQLNDVEMQNLIFTWWRVNKHFFLRSAFRLVRTKIQRQSAGLASSIASSATDTKSRT